MTLETKADPIKRERAGFLRGRETRVDYKTRKKIADVYSHPILFRCIDQIAQSAASIDWDAYGSDGEKIERSDIERLLKRPSPQVDGSALIYHLIMSMIALGDGYLTAVVGSGGRPLELWNIDAGEITIKFDKDGSVSAYVYKSGTPDERAFELDDNGSSLEIMRFSRNSVLAGKYLGQSGLKPAEAHAHLYMSLISRTIDLADNSINDSGILTIKDVDADSSMTDEQFNQFKEQLRAFRNGGKRSGDIAILENMDVEFQRLSKDIETNGNTEQQNNAARMICSVFGVPPMLLGIPGDNTYSNYQAARAAFWTDTLVPYYLTPLGRTLSRWFFGDENIELRPDLSSVPALAAQHIENLKCYDAMSYLTINEKRAKAGLEPVEGGDTLYIPLSNVPLGEVEDTTSEDDEKNFDTDMAIRLVSNADKRSQQKT